jgi:hypothetical protein
MFNYFKYAPNQVALILTMVAGVVVFDCIGFAAEQELEPGTIRVTHDAGSPIITIITEYGYTEVSRFKYSAKGINAMTLRVIAVSKEDVRELGKAATGVLAKDDRGSIYLAMTRSITSEATNKKFASSCSIISKDVSDGQRTVVEEFDIDPALKFSSSAYPNDKIVAAGDELVLWAYCWGEKKDADTRQTVAGLLERNGSYDELTKEVIIREVQKQGNAFVVLAILESEKADEKQDK